MIKLNLHLKNLITAILLTIITVVASAYSVSALSSVFTDSDQSQTYVIVADPGNGTLLDALTAEIQVYSVTPNFDVILEDICEPWTPFNAGIQYSRNELIYLHSQNSSETNTGILDSFRTATDCASGQDDVVFTVNAGDTSQTSIRGNLNLYTVQVQVIRLEDQLNGFKVRTAPSTGNYVTFAELPTSQAFNRGDPSGGQNSFALVDREFRLPSTFESQPIDLRFGADCSLNAAQEAYIKWEDADYGQGNENNNLSFRLRNTTTNSYENLNVYTATSGGPILANVTTVSGASLGGNGPGSFREARFTVRPDNNYIWEWRNVSEANGIQIWMPFNQLNYVVDCDDWDYTPRLFTTSTPAPNTTVYPGDEILIRGDARNVRPADGPVNNLHIYSNIGGGEVTVIGNSSGGSQVGDRVEWNGQPGIPGNGDSANRWVRYTVDSDAISGAQVCFRVRVSPNSPTNSGYQYTGANSWCYTVGSATGWNYIPRIQNFSPSSALVSTGDSIQVVGDARNSGSGAGANFELQIVIPSADRPYLSLDSAPGGSVVGSPGYYSIWNESGLAPSANSPDRTANFTVGSTRPADGEVCVWVRARPFQGTTTPPPITATSSGWSPFEEQCFTVELENYDYTPTITLLDDTGAGESGVQIMRGDDFRTRATISNSDVGVNPYTTQSYAYSGGSNVTRNGSTSPTHSGIVTNPGYTWTDSNGTGGSPELYTGGFTVNPVAPLGRDAVCFRSNVFPAEGQVGGSIIQNVRESALPPACLDIYDVYDHDIVGVGSVAIPGQTAEFTVTNSGGGAGRQNPAYSLSGGVTDSGTLPGSIQPGGDSRTISFTVPSNAGVGSFCVTARVSPETGRVYDNIGADTAADTGTAQVTHCWRIAEQPYLIVNGADVQAGGEFADSTNPFVCGGTTTGGDNASITSVQNTGKNIGAQTEYGLFATGDIFDFGSNGQIGSSATTTTFANTGVQPGDFSDEGRCITNYYTLLRSEATNTGSTNLSSLASNVIDQYRYTGSSPNLSGTIPSGGQLIYIVEGDVDITDDIRYQSNYSAADPSEIPFFMLIAYGGDINIEADVDVLDGLYVAIPNGATGGNIDTCNHSSVQGGSPQATISTACDRLLTINGAFISQTVDFNRTEGGLVRAGTNSDSPAELFNFSPELYLALPNFRSPFFGDFDTEQFKDLPPVY